MGGAKLIGKVGGTAVAYLGAVDDNGGTPAVHPVANLLRLRRDLGASSTVGIAYTDRFGEGFWNRVVGTDARVIWKKIWFSTAQIVGSWTNDGSASGVRDRKSTRLNSSHLGISYAVFCLKKKKQ